jgi:hypothetical protein
MTPENAWLYGVLPFVTMAVLTAGFVIVFRQRSAARRAALGMQPVPRRPDRPARPWWGNPLVWVAIGLVSVVLGVLVWPGLFGFTFIFIPILWWRTPKTPPLDPRSNGHTHRDAGSFMPE